jgi:hypothetical protein
VDQPTRIGIGATALGTFAGIGSPFLTWWVSGPVMGACALTALWGFWPIFDSVSLGHVALWRVPLRAAAQICFEKSEGTVAGDVIGAEYRDEDDRISFLYSGFVAHHIPLFGRVPPSRNARPIPEPALRNMTIVEGTNNLRRIAGQQQVEYLDCYMLRPALWKHVRHLRSVRRHEDI